MRRIVTLCMIILIVSGLTVNAQDEALIFTTDFEVDVDGLNVSDQNGVNYPHTFVEEDGRSLMHVETKEAPVYFMLNPRADWEEYSVEFETRMNWGYLTFYTSPDCDGHSVVMDMLAHTVRIAPITSDCYEGSNTVLMPSIEMNRDEWVTIRIEVRQDRLIVFVNGERLTDLQDEAVVGKAPYLYFEHIDPDFIQRTAFIEFDSLTVSYLSTEAEGRTSRDSESETEAEVPLTGFDPAGTQQEIIDSLRVMGYLPDDGGSYLFGEDYAYFFGQGDWFTPLASRSPRTDVVMAGELTFTYGESDELQSCSLMAHVSVDGAGTATQLLQAGVDDAGYAYVFDAASETSVDYYDAFINFDSGDTVHLLLVVIGGNTSVFIDGEVVIDNEKTDNRSGSYGISLSGRTADDGCEGGDIWVWSFDE